MYVTSQCRSLNGQGTGLTSCSVALKIDQSMTIGVEGSNVALVWVRPFACMVNLLKEKREQYRGETHDHPRIAEGPTTYTTKKEARISWV